MKLLISLLTSVMATSASLHAEWAVLGDRKLGSISGSPKSIASPVTLAITAPDQEASLRFDSISIPPTARAVVLDAMVETDIPAGKPFRITVTFASSHTYPDEPTKLLSRSHRILKGKIRERIYLNVPLPPRQKLPSVLYAFVEIAGNELDRSGKPGKSQPGTMTVRDMRLTPSILPASRSTNERKKAYLHFTGLHTLSGSPGRINNKTALRLPGLLASVMDVKSANDPRITRFIGETSAILKGMRDNKVRLGPFEIFFPIANHVAAKKQLGSLLASHPDYKEYERLLIDYQSAWADYKSNGSDSPRRPIREAKTIADVPADIDNGNFRLLVTAAGYLSAQEFPELRTKSIDPSTKQETIHNRDRILREMGFYIHRVYHSITTLNTSEYGSQTYLAIDFAPIHIIAEHARDPEIRKIATHTLDWLYSSLAASWNQGHYINSAARSKGEFLGTGSGLGFIGWFVFDTGRTIDAMTTPFLVYPALPGAYQLPPDLRPFSSLPFVKREKIGKALHFVSVYTFQSRSFGLTTSMENRNPPGRSKPKWDTDSFFKEAGRHKLNWLGDKPGGFVPQWQNSAQPYASRRNQPNSNYYGLNPWSYVIQHRGTQIGLADVHNDYPFRQLYTIYPGNGSIRKRLHMDATGWTLCHTGRTVFAFRSLKPATSRDEKWPDKADSTDRFDYKKTAWILEAVDAPQSSTSKTDDELTDELQKFHRTLSAAKVEAKHLDDADATPPSLSYTSPVSGKTLRLDAGVYPVPHDGENVPIADYPVLATFPDSAKSPRIRQEKDRLRWLDGDGKILFERDFTPWIQP